MIAPANKFDFLSVQRELGKRTDEWFAAYRRETDSAKLIEHWSDVLVSAMLDRSVEDVARRSKVDPNSLTRWQRGDCGTLLVQAGSVCKTLKLSLDGVFGIVPIGRYRLTVMAQQIGVSREMFYRAPKHADCRLVTAVKLAKFFSFSLDRLTVVGIKGK